MCSFFFSSRRRHTRCSRDWSSDVCSSDLPGQELTMHPRLRRQLATLRSDLPPEFRQLIAAVDAAYRENDAERAELEESVASLTALLHRAQTRAGRGVENRKERRAKAVRAQKRLGRLLEKSRL